MVAWFFEGCCVLDCYWVGSLDFSFFVEIKLGFPLNPSPPKKNHLHGPTTKFSMMLRGASPIDREKLRLRALAARRRLCGGFCAVRLSLVLMKEARGVVRSLLAVGSSPNGTRRFPPCASPSCSPWVSPWNILGLGFTSWPCPWVGSMLLQMEPPSDRWLPLICLETTVSRALIGSKRAPRGGPKGEALSILDFESFVGCFVADICQSRVFGGAGANLDSSIFGCCGDFSFFV